MSVNEIKVTTRFARKGKVEQAGQFEMVEAEAIIEQVFDGDVDPEALTEVIEDQFITIKAQVFSQLGLTFEQAEETGMVFETFPGAQVVEEKAPAKRKAKLAPVPEPEDEDEDEEDEEEEVPPPKKKAVAKKAPAKAAEPDLDDIEPQDDKEEMFLDMMKRPKNWKLANSKNPNGPRWQHTTKKRPGTQYAVGLWAKDAPDWFEDPFA